MQRIYLSITKNSRQLVLFAYMLLIALSPSLHPNNQDIITYHDTQRVLELILIALVLINSTLSGISAPNIVITNDPIRKAALVLFGFTAISIYLAQSIRHAVIEVSIFSGLFYFSLFIASQYINHREAFIRRLTYLIWISVLLYMANFYSGYIIATITKTPILWPKPFSGFTNVRSFNQYQLWLLALTTLPLLAFELKSHIKLLIYFALACWWALLFYSASRGVLIAWLIGILFTVAIYQKTAWPVVRIQIINITTGFIGYYLLFKLIPTISKTTMVTNTIIRETTNDRLDLWGNALEIIYHFPLFGAGPMNYPWYNLTLSHPHNSILQLAAEWGLPAAFMILAIAGYSIYCWLKKMNLNKLKTQTCLNKNLSMLLLFTIVTNAAYSLVDGVIVMPVSQVLMFTIIGITIGHYHQETLSISNDKNSTTNFRLKSPVAMLVLIALICSTWPEIKQAMSDHNKRFSMGYTAAGPRIWWEIK